MGMFLSPSLNTPTVVPLMAAVDAFATSALVMPANVCAVRIDLNPLLNIIREPIIPKNGNSRSLTDDILSLPGNLSQRTNIASFVSRVDVLLPGNQQLYGILDRIRLKLANRNPRSWYFLVQCVLDRAS